MTTCRRMGVDDVEPLTPVSCNGSDTDSDDLGYQTPLTSPEPSPTKKRAAIGRLPPFHFVLGQLDGGGDGNGVGNISALDTPPLESPVDLSPPKKRNPHVLSPPRTPSRSPTVLLQHCEGLATPRQRQLMNAGIGSPDRFIPSRTSTPMKDGLLLSTPARYGALFGKSSQQQGAGPDPFAPALRRSVRMIEQYATRQSPVPPPRSTGLVSTNVQDAVQSSVRSLSSGAVWTVGGLAVTEGVASITNGRGGRITSGTNAPHYYADFHRRQSQSEEQLTHGRRLALAMNIEQAGRLMNTGTSSRSSSSRLDVGNEGMTAKGKTVWRHGRWETPGAYTCTYVRIALSRDQVNVLQPPYAGQYAQRDFPSFPFECLMRLHCGMTTIARCWPTLTRWNVWPSGLGPMCTCGPSQRAPRTPIYPTR